MNQSHARKPNYYERILHIIKTDLELVERDLQITFKRNPFINKGCRAVTKGTNRIPGNLINMRGFCSVELELVDTSLHIKFERNLFINKGCKAVTKQPIACQETKFYMRRFRSYSNLS